MKYLKAIILLVFLSTYMIINAQNDSLIRVIVTTPEIIIADEDDIKILEEYELAYVLSDRKYSQKILEIETKKESFDTHFQYLGKFLPNLTYENDVTFDLSIALQNHLSMRETNIAFLPVPYNVGHSIANLEELAINESADYIIFIQSVEFRCEKREINRIPSYFLYDQKLKQVLVKPLSSDFDKNYIIERQHAKRKAYKIKTYNQWTYLRILSVINTDYQLPKDQ